MRRCRARLNTRKSGKPWLWVLVSIGILIQTATNIARPASSYKVLELGLGAEAVGYMTAAYAILPLFLVLIAGRLAGRLADFRFFVTISVLAIFTGILLLALSGNFFPALVGSSLLGLGHLLFTIGGQSIVARVSSKSDVDQNFGWFTASVSLGQMVGPLVNGLILGVPSDRDIAVGAHSILFSAVTLSLLSGAALSFASLALVPRLHTDGYLKSRKKRNESDELDTGKTPSMLDILMVEHIKPYLLASIALIVMTDILTAFLPLVGESAGVSPLTVGVLLMLRGLTSVLSRMALGKMAWYFSRRVLVIASCFIPAVLLALLPTLLEQNSAGILISSSIMIISGWFLGIGQPLTMGLVSTMVLSSWRSSALGVRLLGNRLGQFLIPAGAGLISASTGGAAALWLASGLLAGAGTLVYKTSNEPITDSD